MQVLPGYADGQAGALRRQGAPALLVLRGRAATVDVVVTPLGHQQVETQTINRFYAARGKPDATCTGRTAVRSRIIQSRSLSTRLDINVVLDHGIYLTERIEPREGPAASPIPPDCASPG